MADNSAFISYRRDTGYPWARLIWDGLRDRGINAFLDLESMRVAGRFDERLFRQISARPYFLVVLTDGTLDRCRAADDWMRREIEHAVANHRVVVPIFIAPFAPARISPDVPEHIRRAVSESNGVTVYSQYLTAAFDLLVDDRLTPVTIDTASVSSDDEQFVARAEQELSALAPPPVPATPEPSTEIPSLDPTPRTPATGQPTPPGHAPTREPESGSPADAEPPPLVIAADLTPTPTTPIEPAPSLQPSRSEAPTAERTSARAAPTSGTTSVRGPGEAPGRSAARVDGGVDPDAQRRRPPALVVTGLLVAAALAAGFFLLQGDRVSDRLDNDEFLAAGDRIVTDDGRHELLMTDDGVLALLTEGTVVWRSSYAPAATALAYMQDDGNFVVYRGRNSSGNPTDPLFATNTQGNVGAFVVVEPSGSTASLVVRSTNGRELFRRPSTARAPAAEPNGASATSVAPPGTTSTTVTSGTLGSISPSTNS